MNVLILGCGAVGTLTGEILTSQGHAVVGVRRSSGDGGEFRIVQGDFSERDVHESLRGMVVWDAILITANPGIRRGRDNRLREGATLVNELYPHARVVYTGTTSIYAGAQGESVDEQGALSDDAEAKALVAIEAEVARHGNSLILRATALVGPSRTAALEKLHAGCVAIRGPLERPFSYIHEQDLAELCAEAVLDSFGVGILNAAAPDSLTIRDYYRLLADRAGVSCDFIGDDAPMPSRRVDARRLQAMCPGRAWRGVND